MEDNVRRTRQLMQAMQSELQRIHRDYGVASSTLQELAEGLREGAGSAGTSPAVVRTRQQQSGVPLGAGGTWGSMGGATGPGFR